MPGKSEAERPGSQPHDAGERQVRQRRASTGSNPGVYQHIGYPSVVQMPDGTIVASYHEWSEDERPLQYVRCTRFRLAD